MPKGNPCAIDGPSATRKYVFPLQSMGYRSWGSRVRQNCKIFSSPVRQNRRGKIGDLALNDEAPSTFVVGFVRRFARRFRGS